MAAQAEPGEYRFKSGGSVSIRPLEAGEFAQRIEVVRTSAEIVWASSSTILIEERAVGGVTTVYVFDPSEDGRKMYVKVLLALIANGAPSSPPKSGGRGPTGAPVTSVVKPPKAPLPVGDSPSIWHLPGKNLKA